MNLSKNSSPSPGTFLSWEIISVFQEFDLTSIFLQRPEKFFCVEESLFNPRNCPNFEIVFKQFSLFDLSKTEVTQLMEKWKNFLELIQVYLGNYDGRFIEEDNFQSKIRKILNLEDLDFGAHIGIRFIEKNSIFSAHTFSIQVDYFRKFDDSKQLSALFEPILAFYTFHRFCFGGSVWDPILTECTHVLMKTEDSIIASSPMDGACVIKDPDYPVEVEISGGDGDFVIGLVEKGITAPISPDKGYFFQPKSANNFRGKAEATKGYYTSFSSDEKFVILYENSKLFVGGIHHNKQLIYDNLPDNKYMLCFLFNHGSISAKIIS